MTEEFVARAILFGSLALPLLLLLLWKLREGRKRYEQAVAFIDRRTAETIAEIDEAASQALAEITGGPATHPTLVVSFTLKPEGNPWQALNDCLRLCATLSDYERELGGKGLLPKPTDAGTGSVEANVFRFGWVPADPKGAKSRLERIAASLNRRGQRIEPRDPIGFVPSAVVYQTAFDPPTAVVTTAG